MADVIYGYAPEVVEAIRETAPPAVRRLIDSGVVVVAVHDLSDVDSEGSFEYWLIEKWLREVRSETYRETAEYEYLRAEWERVGGWRMRGWRMRNGGHGSRPRTSLKG